MPRDVLLDTQGRAIEQLLKISKTTAEDSKLVDSLSCRVGKYIELNFKDCSQEVAETQAKKIAEQLLINPLLEKFELQILGETK